MAGLTEHGLTIKRLHEVIADSKARAQPIFQDLVPPGDIVDTSDSTTIGRLIGLKSPAIADLWEAVQQVYLAFDPNSATGIALDNLVALGGITRIPESPTTADVYLTGNSGITIPFGSEVMSSTTSARYQLAQEVPLFPENCFGVGVNVNALQPTSRYSVFYTIADGTAFTEIFINTGITPTIEGIYEDIQNQIRNNHQGLTSYVEDGVLYITSDIDFQLLSFYTSLNLSINKVIGIGRVVGEVPGAIEQPPRTIDQISTPVFGWDSVINPTQALTGNSRETDSQLRNRFRETKFQRATNIIEALYSALYSVNGVTSIIIYENDTDVIDSRGVLPHSFWVIVDGGIDTDVARAIWLNRPTGIRSQGNTRVDIIDSFGYIREINFSRPEAVELYVRMDISTNQDFPPNGEEQIKKNLVEYINSLVISEDVVYSRLYTPINKVIGHQVDSLEISTNGVDWQTTNIFIDLDQKATLTENNITIV